MQTSSGSSILQTSIQKREKDNIANDGRKTVRRAPSNHKQAERQLIRLIDEGVLRIDGQGYIWRTKVRKGMKKGGSHLITIQARRAENKTGHGYFQVRATIGPGGPRIHGLAHRLVWQHFFGEIPDGLCINHKNGNKTDNRPANLELVTYSDNQKHAFRTGLINQNGERNPRASITNERARIIREIYAEGNIRQTDLARRMNIPFQTMSRVIRGEVYSDAGGPIDKGDHRGFSTERDSETGQFVPKDQGGRVVHMPLLDGRRWNQIPEEAK